MGSQRGFHLSCDAENDKAVSVLRSRKYREDKPFAVMCRDLEEVRRHCELEQGEQDLLLSNERPIVLLNREPRLLWTAVYLEGLVVLKTPLAPAWFLWKELVPPNLSTFRILYA
jgi:hydrogenase maturation protein HypF